MKSERDKAWDTIHHVFPDIENQIDIVYYQVTIPEKAAVSIDGYIPGVWTPVSNLYLVGMNPMAAVPEHEIPIRTQALSELIDIDDMELV